MLDFLKSRGFSFRYAISGWAYVIRTQRNAWIHALATLVVILAGFWLHLDRDEWALIVIAIAIVWIAEFLNTALEAVVDLTCPDQTQLAKVGKDVGAAAVLIAASASFLVGIFVLGPPLWSRLQALSLK